MIKDNYYPTYHDNRFVKENTFIGKALENNTLPDYESDKNKLPKPIWDGHPDHLACYDKAWQIAYSNLRMPVSGTGFVS
ncbi:MAG: glycoside hydrolase, partial [Clostridia bacterium]|nr:glycoside hydrolase [Clostridia bacterium]